MAERSINIFLRMIPPTTTFQDKGLGVTKSGRAYQYDRDGASEVKEKFKAHLARHVPEKPFDAPVEVLVRFFYPETKDHPAGSWKTTKPDLDNMNKILGDVLQEMHFIKNDSAIAHLDLLKMFSDVPGVLIRINEMEE